MSKATATLRDPVIESGVITSVNMARFTADVATQVTFRRYLGIPVMAPYLHQYSGEGISIMPEVGCPVWICQSSESDTKPFILGFGGLWNKEGTYRAARPPMNPGDIYIATRDRNCVFLRRGGIVQIQATPLAQRMYLPIGNLIRDICENYSLHTFSGDFVWEVDRSETTTAGDRPTRMRLLAKEKADDEKPIAQLIMGEHSDNTRVSLEVYASGSSTSVKASLEITKAGNVSWKVKGEWSTEVDGDWTVRSSKGNTVLKSATGTSLVEGQTKVTLRSSKLVEVRSPQFHVGPLGSGLDITMDAGVEVKLAGGGSPLVKGDALLTILSPLLTALSTMTVPTLAASLLAVSAAASTALPSLAQLNSSKVTTG